MNVSDKRAKRSRSAAATRSDVASQRDEALAPGDRAASSKRQRTPEGLLSRRTAAAPESAPPRQPAAVNGMAGGSTAPSSGRLWLEAPNTQEVARQDPFNFSAMPAGPPRHHLSTTRPFPSPSTNAFDEALFPCLPLAQTTTPTTPYPSDPLSPCQFLSRELNDPVWYGCRDDLRNRAQADALPRGPSEASFDDFSALFSAFDDQPITPDRNHVGAPAAHNTADPELAVDDHELAEFPGLDALVAMIPASDLESPAPPAKTMGLDDDSQVGMTADAAASMQVARGGHRLSEELATLYAWACADDSGAGALDAGPPDNFGFPNQDRDGFAPPVNVMRSTLANVHNAGPAVSAQAFDAAWQQLLAHDPQLQNMLGIEPPNAADVVAPPFLQEPAPNDGPHLAINAGAALEPAANEALQRTHTGELIATVRQNAPRQVTQSLKKEEHLPHDVIELSLTCQIGACLCGCFSGRRHPHRGKKHHPIFGARRAQGIRHAGWAYRRRLE